VRVKELADLAGTTVRTVRYYHQIGLLPVPQVRRGHRDYDLAHVARLIRVRWLAEAGVPLSRVAAMLGTADEAPPLRAGTDRETVLLDLHATIEALDEQLEQLQARRTRVSRMIDAVEQDQNLSPLPAAIERYYARVERRATQETVRRAVRRERDFLELAFYRGELPPEVALIFEYFDEAQVAESAAAFGQLADRRESGAEPTPHQVARIATATIERMRRNLGADLPRLAHAVDLDLVRQAADRYVSLAGDNSRRVERAIVDGLLRLLEEARSQQSREDGEARGD
jgi:DNA-binding transcriptional MerR regulator